MDPRDQGNILGIETSCDETAASVVVGGRDVRSSIVASQIDIHQAYGGVVPEIASREHVKAILPVIDQALRKARVTLDDIDAVAVTYGPGLVGALLVGVSAAKGLADAAEIPLVPIHHIEGHIAAAYLTDPDLAPPFLCLIVSGGHASLMEVVDYTHIRVIGKTRDDAPGEAFDKIARVMDLGYPGGPAMERASVGGDRHKHALPKSTFEDSLDFSFSGLKTAAIQWHDRLRRAAEKEGDDPWPSTCSPHDFAATFQEAIVETLVEHTAEALDRTHHRQLVLGGGVAANRRLREAMDRMTSQRGVRLTVPPLSLCTDNAAMVASAGYYAWRDGRRAGRDLNAVPMADIERRWT